MTEAMACGTPVITPPLGAAPEIADRESPGSCAPRSVRWWTPWRPAAELRPADCRSRVDKLFSAQAMVTGYEAVYRTALARTGPLNDQGGTTTYRRARLMPRSAQVISSG